GFGVDSINRRRGSNYCFPYAMQLGGFQKIDCALDIHSLVRSRLLEAGPDSGARRQVDDLVELNGTHQGIEGRSIEQISRDKDKRSFERLDGQQISPL